MRERIEDLGKLSVMLERVLSHQLWPGSSREDVYLSEMFFKWTPDAQKIWLDNMSECLFDVRDELIKCLGIANGTEED